LNDLKYLPFFSRFLLQKDTKDRLPRWSETASSLLFSKAHYGYTTNDYIVLARSLDRFRCWFIKFKFKFVTIFSLYHEIPSESFSLCEIGGTTTKI